jgi:hypothetical protein
MSDIVERLRYATRDVVTGERLESGVYGHAPVEDLEKAADRIVVLEGALGHAEREAERLRDELQAWKDDYGLAHAGAVASERRAREAEAERDALLTIMVRCAAILRGSEDEDQGAAYDNAQRVLDAAIDEAVKRREA